MRKFRLIKTFPGSEPLGTEFIFGEDPNWKCAFCITNGQKKYYVIWTLEYFQNTEFFKEVIEKDYEILQFKEAKGRMINNKLKNGLFAFVTDLDYEGGICEEYLLERSDAYVIWSVKRLSDGEIFTVGDEVINVFDVKVKIKSIYIVGNSVDLSYGAYGANRLKDVKKVKSPIFTTEDGVDVYEDIYNYIYIVDSYFTIFKVECTKDNLEIVINAWSDRKRFSTEKAAEEYILMNKPCLSLKECVATFKSDTAKDKLVDLVKSRL